MEKYVVKDYPTNGPEACPWKAVSTLASCLGQPAWPARFGYSRVCFDARPDAFLASFDGATVCCLLPDGSLREFDAGAPRATPSEETIRQKALSLQWTARRSCREVALLDCPLPARTPSGGYIAYKLEDLSFVQTFARSEITDCVARFDYPGALYIIARFQKARGPYTRALDIFVVWQSGEVARLTHEDTHAADVLAAAKRALQ